MRAPLLIALALAALAGPAAAAPRLHGIPSHVRAGQKLRITWSGLAPEVREAELELSLAGGRWVRLSPELEAREGGFTWHVPAGLAGPARLRFKCGGEWFEAEGQVSAPFVIEADPGMAITRVLDPVLDDWWDLGRHSGALPIQSVSGAVSIHRTDPTLALSPEPYRIASVALSSTGRTPMRETLRDRCDAGVRRGALTRSYPLRI